MLQRFAVPILLTLVVAVNVPFLSPRFVFLHDTLNNFITFHYAYSDLFLNSEFPRWIPYTAYGLPFDFSLFSSLLPADYLAMGVGWLLGIQDVPRLFLCSLIVSQCFYVLGLYLLVSRLFATRLAVWMVCLGALLTNSWIFNVSWSFTSFYLLPLELYFVIDFVESERARSLWIAGNIEVLSLLGTVSYIAPVHMLVMGTFVLTLVWQKPGRAWLFLRPSNFLQPLFLTFMLGAALLGRLALGMEVEILSPFRDPGTGNVPLEVFLTLYRYPLAGVLAAMLRGDVPIGEFIVYAGLLPYLTAGYALIRRRQPWCVPFAAVALVLFWFSMAGWFATFTYYVVPMMNKFRHISFALDTFKVFLIILGGFGIDQLLGDLSVAKQATTPAKRGWRAWPWLGLGLLTCMAIDVGVHFRPEDDMELTLWTCDQSYAEQWFAPLVLAARLLAYAGLLIATIVAWRMHRRGEVAGLPRMLGPIILAVYLADVGFFYTRIVEQAPFVTPNLALHDEQFVQDLTYHSRRSLDMEQDRPERVRKINKTIRQARHGFFLGFSSIYASLYVHMRLDLLEPRFRLDQIMPEVKKMIEARGGQVPGVPAIETPPGDPKKGEKKDLAFLRSLGFETPKVRIVRQVIFAENEADALRQFARGDPTKTLIIDGVPVALPSEPVSFGPGTPDSAIVTRFTANTMSVSVWAQTAGWLFRADAFHSGWRATANSEPLPVLRANIGCQAVPIPAGFSTVEFRFDGGPRQWIRRGVVLFASVLASLLVIGLTAEVWRQIHSTPGSPSVT